MFALSKHLFFESLNYIAVSCVFLLITSLSIPLLAQPKVKFKRYTQEDGLSQEYIFCMIQDSRGLMWFGTEDGLDKFDGYHFTHYRHIANDTTSLSYNTVWSLYEDRQGNIWAGTLTGELNRFDRRTETFTRYAIPFTNVITRPERTIIAIAEDRAGTLWVGTIGAGLYYRKVGEKDFSAFVQDAPDQQNSGQDRINVLLRDGNGDLWIGTDNGLKCYDYNKNNFIQYKHDPLDAKSIRHNNITSLALGRDGKLWVGTAMGIDRYDTVQKQFERFGANLSKDCKVDSIRVIALQEDLEQNLWVTTPQGVLKFAWGAPCFQQFVHSPFDLQSISGRVFYGVLIDAEGGVWIGTRTGVNRYDAKLHRFRHYAHEPGNPSSLPDNIVWLFQQDRTGLLWVTTGTRRCPFDLQKGIIPDHELPPVIYKHIIQPKRRFLLEDRAGNIWTGIDTLHAINRKTGQLRKFYHNPDDVYSIGSYFVTHGHEGRDSTIWFIIRGGMSIFNYGNNTFENYYTDLHDGTRFGNTSSVTHFFEDREGTMWLGMRGSGLVRVDRQAKKFIHFQHNPKDTTSISDDVIHVIQEDHQGLLWVSTPSGLNLMLDKEKGTFRRIREKDGLSNDHLFGILEDSRHRLWMSSNKGITCYDPTGETFRLYDVADGLSSSSFNDDSYHMDSITGEMFFGCANGFTVFHPDSIRDDTFIPPVIISRFQYLIRSKNSAILIEEKGISEKNAIRLTHRQKTLLLFEFASLSYSKPGKNKYQYQLKGYSKDWVQLGARREASFTNLNPGHYTLRVKGSNGDGIWNDVPTELHITILAPWYWAWYSQFIYFLLFIGGIYYFYRFQLGRRLAEKDAKLAQERASYLEALNVAKNRFYENTTHEFRTPLTIILGTADLIRRAPDEWLEKGLTMIKNNGQNLLRLVRQMLDLSKLETSSLPVHLVQGDIVLYLRTLLELLRSNADDKDITLDFISKTPEIIMDYDPDKIRDIITNLLHNALKFTSGGGLVQLIVERQDTQDQPQLLITVQDTGVGIPADKLPYIFDRFYQVDDSMTRKAKGTGIGLALVKELTKLLGGDIQVRSELGQGAVFTVQLPIEHKAPRIKDLPTLESEWSAKSADSLAVATPDNSQDLPLALIVEDNRDVITYLQAHLQNEYRMEVAHNGQAGIDKAIELVPDVILSDVMMPERDGFDLCRTLKNDRSTSHIPIILITARADMESRLTGLEGGADAYLVKPFNEAELKISLRKFLELRQRLQERYAQPSIPLATSTFFSIDDTFVKELQALVAAEYSSLTVGDMAKKLYMSQPQLGRKVKALLKMSPSKYLNEYRMQIAFDLVKNTDTPIQDIAYQVGFSDPAYFSNAFFKKFKQRPSELRNHND